MPRFRYVVLQAIKVAHRESPFGLTMNFYSTHEKHHDIALVEQPEPEELAPDWSVAATRGRINHIAIAYPDRDTFLAQLVHLKACGVEVKLRGNHGMTHSAYISDPDGNGPSTHSSELSKTDLCSRSLQPWISGS